MGALPVLDGRSPSGGRPGGELRPSRYSSNPKRSGRMRTESACSVCPGNNGRSLHHSSHSSPWSRLSQSGGLPTFADLLASG